MTTDPRILGTFFVRRLRKELGIKKFNEMRRLNAQEPNPGVCHSHDFCDANMTMLWAYCDLTGVAEDDVDLDAVVDLFNNAWGYASSHGLGR